MAHTRIGVDIGGTKTEAVVVAFEEADAMPNVLARDRIPTAKDEGYDAIVANTARLIGAVARAGGVALEDAGVPIGIGMPGGVTRRKPDGTRSDVPLVKNSNATVLNGRAFHDDLSRAVGRPIVFSNDASCFALAEATWGAARGAKVAFGVIMGTGIGGGVVLRDRDGAFAWDGAQGIAGEWGHVVLDPVNGPPCYCGRRGCIEQFLSGPAIERAYEERAGVKRSLVEIAARTDDAEAKTLLDERTEIFGRALATIIDVLDPEVIVLGGGVSNLPHWTTTGRDAVARWVFNDTLETKIVRHALGDSAGVFGAALLPR